MTPVLERFRQLVEPIFPSCADRGWEPFWHLTRDKAWTCFKGGEPVAGSVFPTGRPKGARQLKEHVEYAASPPDMATFWNDAASRQTLQKELILMLGQDDDEAAQAVGEYFSVLYLDSNPRAIVVEPDPMFQSWRIEDYSRLRAHMRIERSRRLADEVKRVHGTTCALCKFDFEDAYGALGTGYIEAHHLIPVSRRKGTKAELDPRLDFIVLCSNCHRMVHRARLPDDLESFRNSHGVPKYKIKSGFS